MAVGNNKEEAFESERRKGTRELYDSVQCLRGEFRSAMVLLQEDINWREKEAKPILKRMLMWQGVFTGISLVATLMLGAVVYIFHSLEVKVDSNWAAMVQMVKETQILVKSNTDASNRITNTMIKIDARLEATEGFVKEMRTKERSK